MELGLIGAGIGLVTLLITIFIIRKICDLIIALGFIGAVAIPFVLGSGGFPPEQMFLIALGLGVGMPIITLPLWSISKIMRGGEDKKIEKLKEKEKEDFEKLKEKYDLEINDLKKEIKNLVNQIKSENKEKEKENPLKELESLKEKGLISEEEYDEKKKEISNKV